MNGKVVVNQVSIPGYGMGFFVLLILLFPATPKKLKL
jgi:hypothetical protein